MKKSLIFHFLILLIFLGCNLDKVDPVTSPTAKFSINNNNCEAPCDPGFVNSSSNATSYQWDFGDGSTSTDQNPTHTYSSAGNYTVRLIARGAGNTQNEATQTVNIQASTQQVLADFEYEFSSCGGFAPTTVMFTNTSQNADSYTWNFGDGTTSSDENPTHTFSNSNVYSIKLTATKGGERDEMMMNITVLAPSTFEKNFDMGLNDREIGYGVVQAQNGDIIVTGFRAEGQNNDVFLARFDKNGNEIWKNNYGGTKKEEGRSVIETANGDLVVAGFTQSIGEGGWDMYLIKTNKDGAFIWEKTFGGSGSDYGYEVVLRDNGGYAISGHTNSMGAGANDIFLVLTDENGNNASEKTFGSADFESSGYQSLSKTNDGGYVITGTRENFSAGVKDVYVVRVDKNGDKIWDKSYDEGGDDFGHSIKQTDDGGFIVGGYSSSFGSPNQFTLLRLDASGNTIWYKGFTEGGNGYSVLLSNDGGYVLMGSNGDLVLLKTNKDGVKEWSNTYGGGFTDSGYGAAVANDCGYILTGRFSFDFTTSNYNAYLVKTDAEGSN